MGSVDTKDKEQYFTVEEKHMVELTEEIIDVMSKMRDAINKTDFKINAFRVGTTGTGEAMIEFDIRRHKKKE